MTCRHAVGVLIVASLVCIVLACSPIPNPPLADCGTFSFDPKTDENPTGQAALFELTFTHNPTNCPIRCGNYWFVQALRPYDLDAGTFIQPYSTQQSRTVKGQSDEYFNGWALDRKHGRLLGWYGVTNSFQFDPPSGIQGGNISDGSWI